MWELLPIKSDQNTKRYSVIRVISELAVHDIGIHTAQYMFAILCKIHHHINKQFHWWIYLQSYEIIIFTTTVPIIFTTSFAEIFTVEMYLKPICGYIILKYADPLLIVNLLIFCILGLDIFTLPTNLANPNGQKKFPIYKSHVYTCHFLWTAC